MTSVAWSCSAHAKDIWTQSRSALIATLASQWTVTCSRHGYERLRSLSPRPEPVHFSYHGLDIDNSPFSDKRPPRTGGDPDHPLQIFSIARAVPKKGLDVLLRALSTLDEDFHWRLIHVGGGGQLSSLQRLARTLAIGDRITWLGTRSQDEVLGFYRQADLFVLPCRTARNGDRDGVPNVLVEASSQRFPASRPRSQAYWSFCAMRKAQFLSRQTIRSAWPRRSRDWRPILDFVNVWRGMPNSGSDRISTIAQASISCFIFLNTDTKCLGIRLAGKGMYPILSCETTVEITAKLSCGLRSRPHHLRSREPCGSCRVAQHL